MEAHSTSESVCGSLHKDQRPYFVWLDDFETNKTKDSKAYIEQVQKHIDEFAIGLSSNAAVLYQGNYITKYGVVRRLFDRAKDDPRLVVHNVPVINEAGEPTWPAKYALTDAEAQRTGKVSLEDKKRQVGLFVRKELNHYRSKRGRPAPDNPSRRKEKVSAAQSETDLSAMAPQLSF